MLEAIDGVSAYMRNGRMDLSLIMCGVAPGSLDADALNLIASWNADESAERTTAGGQP